jgi:hypothetical protein
MKKIAAFLLTAALIAGAVYLSVSRQSGENAGPEQVVWRMLDRSREGKVKEYLDCFSNPLRSQLQATARNMTDTKFSEYLVDSSKKLKGAAVSDIRQQDQGQATLVLEYVYADRNEKQRLNLKLENGNWYIASSEGSQRIQPLIPYGKPVQEIR